MTEIEYLERKDNMQYEGRKYNINQEEEGEEKRKAIGVEVSEKEVKARGDSACEDEEYNIEGGK